MTKTLLYLSYGQDRYQQETMFSILSVKNFTQNSDDIAIVVYTDRPELFAWLHVDARSLTQSLLDEWMGTGTYPFRRKLTCLSDVLRSDGGKVAFLDGDTYFRRHPLVLFDRIAPGRSCLHMREIRLSQRDNTAGLAMTELLSRESIRDIDGAVISIRPGEGMWNSGVIGIDASDIHKLDKAIDLVDKIWTYEQRIHTIEQFALGHILAETQLSATDDLVFHYWPKMFRASFLQKLPVILTAARSMPLSTAAGWSYAQRPRSSYFYKIASKVRSIIHWIGLDNRWTRTSA